MKSTQTAWRWNNMCFVCYRLEHQEVLKINVACPNMTTHSWQRSSQGWGNRSVCARVCVSYLLSNSHISLQRARGAWWVDLLRLSPLLQPLWFMQRLLHSFPVYLGYYYSQTLYSPVRSVICCKARCGSSCGYSRFQ